MIDIVLASFNGERFIEQQIRSIQLNDDYDVLINRFIIIDDGSTDKTLTIIEEFIKEDNKIELHHNSSDKHGVKGNFCAGLALTSNEYVMLSDQDDIWFCDKIRRSFDRIKELEVSGKGFPLIVFSDKQIVDDELTLLKNSDYEISKLSKDWHKDTQQLLQRNVASGCTMIMNRALLDIALPIPSQAFMHDWWLVLMASHYGVVELIDRPLMQYRQHNNNVIGAKQRDTLCLLRNVRRNFKLLELNFIKAIKQARHFEKSTQQRFIFATLFDMPRIQRLRLLLLNDITQSRFIRKMLLILVLLKN